MQNTLYTVDRIVWTYWLSGTCPIIPVIRNFMAILGKATGMWFINGSSKRKNILKSKMNMPDENQL
jgi:hypothetical protein